MAKFIFRMQGILNIKQKLEDQQRIVFAQAKARLNAEEEKLENLYKKKAEYIEKKTRDMAGGLNVHELILTENAIKGNDMQIEDQKKVIKRAEKAVLIEQEKLEVCIQERKMYEKLRENAMEEFRAEINYTEQMEINELVSFRHKSSEQG